METHDTAAKGIAVIDTKEAWVVLQKQCMAFIASGFLPEHITKGVDNSVALAKALTIAVKGRELGIPPMQAFSSITVIRGKPCLSAELMLALCYQRARGFRATFTTPPDQAATECTVVMERGGGQPQTFRFTLEEAKAAGLITAGSAWQKYPAAMLRARAISAGCRAVAPDAIMGCYTPEEIGGTSVVDVDELEIASPASPPPAPPPEPTKTKDVSAKPKTLTLMELGFDSPQAHKKAMDFLFGTAKKHGWDSDLIHRHLVKKYRGKPPEQLTWLEFNEFTKYMAANPNHKDVVGSDEDIRNAARES